MRESGREISSIDVSRVLQNRRHVGGEKAFAVRDADDQRAVLSRAVELARKVLEHQRKGIAAAHAHHHAVDRVDRADLVLLVVVVDQLDDHLGVRAAVKTVAVVQKLLLELLEILDDAVVHADHVRFDRSRAGARCVAGNVRMRVCAARLAVRRPARMSDAAESRHRPSFIGHFDQVLELAGRLYDLGKRVAAAHGKARGVIAAVFELFQPFQQDRRRRLRAGISDDSAHITILPSDSLYE